MTDQVVVFEIKEYMIVWRQLEERTVSGQQVKVRAVVRCLGDEYSMDVIFIAPDSPAPKPIFDVEKKSGMLFLPISDIQPFVDTLRNEKPIYGHLRADRAEWTSITTSNEPVGEGEVE